RVTDPRATAPGVTDPRVTGLLDALAEVWQLVLRVRPVPEDDFFALGGDSLLAAEAVTRTLAVFQLDAGLGSTLVRALLAAPTLAGFAEAVREARDGTRRHAAPAEAVDFRREAELGFRLPPAEGPAPRP
ncbi:phosphopantetheine-binding protein, partial [Streptomyces sp. URMC 127]|uniref:phosphopantetheine-binding protein n=1 Tax=Streptomyces sp. URMC 127 TaxID=3423402 RepID=UPI003F1958A4